MEQRGQGAAQSEALSERFVLFFPEIRSSFLPLVGGKGANLGELTAAGFPVPPGFCVRTDAYLLFLKSLENPSDFWRLMEGLDPADNAALRRVGEAVRAALRLLPMPASIAQEVVQAWKTLGTEHSYAVRSSATAEDLPGASFAGQQDTYLHIRGEQALLHAVKECWISLFTDRALAYRTRNGFAHERVRLSVVVQKMVLPERSGIAFSADPLTGHRGIVSIDAGFGLGEAFVSGIVSADLYRVHTARNTVIERKIAHKEFTLRPAPEGGTARVALLPEQFDAPVLSDKEALELASLTRKIEQHYGAPQDVEWCLEEGRFYIVQSRPITTLFPVPERSPEESIPRAYLSFNHLQVMTEPMPELSRSLFRRIIPIQRRAGAYSTMLRSAGGRLYIDVTPLLRVEATRKRFPAFLRFANALASSALQELGERPAFHSLANESIVPIAQGFLPVFGPFVAKGLFHFSTHDPEQMMNTVETFLREHFAALEKRVMEQSSALSRLRALDRELDDLFLGGIFKMAPLAFASIIALRVLQTMTAGTALEKEISLVVQGIEGNITTEMDLALGDLADVAREFPEVVEHLRTAPAKTVFSTVKSVAGGPVFAREAEKFLERYGIRATSEIDVSRTRWRDDPTPLVKMIVGNLAGKERGAHRKWHAQSIAQAKAASERLVQGLSMLQRPLARRALRVLRYGAALREHPKFHLIRVLWLLRGVVLERGAELVRAGRIEQAEDVFHLGWRELCEFEPLGENVRATIAARKAEHEHYKKLSAPVVLTEEGEAVTGKHNHAYLPPGALPGSGASAGIVEGIVRVVRDPTHDVLEAGEILVAPFTDPGWTPLFINAKGLVMEVGGLMTHGSVVAREYGIPAVVCVPDATKLLKTGMRVRVNGDEGYVEILKEGQSNH